MHIRGDSKEPDVITSSIPPASDHGAASGLTVLIDLFLYQAFETLSIGMLQEPDRGVLDGDLDSISFDGSQLGDCFELDTSLTAHPSGES